MFDKSAIYAVCGTVVVLFIAYSVKDLVNPDTEVPAYLYGMMSVIVTAAIGTAGAVMAVGQKSKKRRRKDEDEEG